MKNRAKAGAAQLSVILVIILVVALAVGVYVGVVSLNLPGGDTVGDGDGDGDLDLTGCETAGKKNTIAGTLEDAHVSGGIDGGAGSLKIYHGIDLSQSADSLNPGTDGSFTSSERYESGEVIWIKADTGTPIRWFKLTVPCHSQGAIDYGTATDVGDVELYDHTAPTISVEFDNSAVSDGGDYNFTASGSNPAVEIQIDEDTDDNGFHLDSYDPVNDITLGSWLVVKFSGTGYGDINLDGVFSWNQLPYGVLETKGCREHASALYCTARLDSKLMFQDVDENGNTIQTGDLKVSFDFEQGSYTGTAGDMDIYLIHAGDYNEWTSTNSWGPDSSQIGTGGDNKHTINLLT